jgi:broad specificity phosphatase PhoE
MEVLLARHGETEWSRSGKHTGRTDVPLTERGRLQAEALGGRLAGRSFAAVLTSPLSRAADTCRLAGLGEAAQERRELLEWDYGEYDGLTTPEIREQRPGWLLWRDGCPGGENAAEVGARADRLIAELHTLDGDAALFAHGHVLRVLAARWVGLAGEAGGLLYLTTATLSVLGFEREIAVIRLWNDGSHLNPQARRRPARPPDGSSGG